MNPKVELLTVTPYHPYRIYTATGTSLATLLATTFVSNTEGGVQLLFRVAKRGLLEEELSGVPKVCECAFVHAHKPETRDPPLVPHVTLHVPDLMPM